MSSLMHICSKTIATMALALVAAATHASSGIYIRGELNGWGAPENHEFQSTSDPNIYSLSLPSLSGEFKIAASDWETIDLGGTLPKGEVLTVSTGKYECVTSGCNFKAVNMTDVTLTLEYNPTGTSWLSISGKTEGDVPSSTGVSGTLPVLYIVTDPIMLSKDLGDKKYRDGTYYLDANGCDWAESIGSADEMLPLEIKARGNWTRLGFAKKPFKLKLGKKQKMLGLSKSKHFALIAHADDNRSYLRNFVGFNLGKRIGLPWTPSQQPVEVVMNGDYRGLYFLTESIRVEEGRIEISELEDMETNPYLCSGGYLIELDNYEEGDQIIQDEINGNDVMRVTFDTPEVYSDLQRQFVEQQFTTMNRMVSDHDKDLWSYMDLDMAARYYIVEEIIDHRESYHGSTYMFRDRGEGQKWIFSPLWDCGNAFGRENPRGYFSDDTLFGNLWVANMRQVPGFMDKVEQTWKWFWGNKVGNNGADILADIDDYLARIEAAAKADRKRWKDAPRPDYPGATDVVDNSDLNPGRDFVKNALKNKVEWLSEVWGKPDANASEPAADTTPAAPLPEFVGIGEIYTPGLCPDAIYNLQGIRISNPEKGQIVIIVKDGKAVKTVM